MTSPPSANGAPPALPSGAPSYEVFGLRLRSALELPGLRPAPPGAAPDAVVRRGRVEAPGGPGPVGISAWPGPDADTVVWRRETRLQISATEIVVDTADDVFARQCVVGPGLGILLHRRGPLVLHGGAVEVDGRAVVVVGHKGAGKSTTSAALVARGHRLLTDDIVVVDEVDGALWVRPGPTQMKLRDNSAEAVGVETERFLDGLDKGVWHGAPPAAGPAPLGLVCPLAWGDHVALAPLAGGAAFGAVFEHVYAPRLLSATAAAPLMGPVKRLVTAAPVRRLVRPPTLDALGAAVRTVEAAVGAGAAAA